MVGEENQMGRSSRVTWNITSGRESTRPDPVLPVTKTDTCPLSSLSKGKEHLCGSQGQGEGQGKSRDMCCNTTFLRCIYVRVMLVVVMWGDG